MSTNAAFLLLTVAASVLLATVQSTCRNPVQCSCENAVKNITICAEEQNTTEIDPCARWPGCRSCEDGSKDLACSTATDLTPRSRQKRQYRQRRPQQGYPVHEDGSRRKNFSKRVKWSWNWRNYRSYPEKNFETSVGKHGDCSEDIDSPKLGSIRCTSSRGRKTCTGTCLPGYTFVDHDDESEMVLSCVNGHWTPGHSFPDCVSGGHCDLEVEGHGRFNCTTGMQGTRCDVYCSSRYVGRYNCYPGRSWAPSLPRCVRPKDGGPSSSQGRQPCRCENGASCNRDGKCVCPVGRTGRFCESVVSTVTCSDPGQVNNADRLNTDGSPSDDDQRYRPGQSVAYTCWRGYALHRRSLITCLRSGKWSNSLPYCTPIRAPDTVAPPVSLVAPDVTCPDPGQVTNADRLNTDGSPSLGVQDYRPGQSVVYTCRTGFALQRRSLITCQTSGTWSNSLPYCSATRPLVNVSPSPAVILSPTPAESPTRGGIVFCSDPGAPTNGFRTTSSTPTGRRFPQGSSIDYSCNQGYGIRGDATLICLDSGRWSSSVPRCEEQRRTEGGGEYCLNPGSILENGKILYYPTINSRRGSEESLDDPEYPPGSRLEYSCNEGYRLQGASVMRCLGDTGLWSTYPPTCATGTSTNIVYCDSLGPLANGQRVQFSNLNSRTGSSRSNTDDPEYPEGTRFEYSCNAGYSMEGRRSQTCEKGRWSSPKPICTRVSASTLMYCDNPGPIINGRVLHFPPAVIAKSGTPLSDDDLEYPEGTRLQYTCDDEFTLIGAAEMTCLSTSHWSSEPPICSSECGFSSALSSIRIFNGNQSVAGAWPWVVSLKEIGGSRIICGGAVLNSRTVITAAHCLTGSSSFSLYFGKVRKLDKDDDGMVEVRTSSRIIIHPNYTVTESTMESDIGLIHFSKRIPFTDRIKPICLPDSQTTAADLRTGNRGFVAGFGDNEFGVQPNQLMHARIPVQDNSVCVEYYRREGVSLLMSENMFCAGHPGGDQATCQGDSGSALVFLDRRSQLFTLEGLVSFATNGQCGVQAKYIVFTKVFPYVPWILTNLAK